MEHFGAALEEEWTSLSGMYTAEEVDFMSQLLGNCPSIGIADSFWPGHESITMNISGNNEGSQHSSEASVSDCMGGNWNGILFPTSSNESYHLSSDFQYPMLVPNSSNIPMSIDFGSYQTEGNDPVIMNQETSEGNGEQSGVNRGDEVAVPEPVVEDKSMKPSKNSMKRSQSSPNVQMSKRNIKAKKSLQVSTSNNEEDGNAGLNRQNSSTSCCSGDDSMNIASHSSTSSLSLKEDSDLDLNGKSKARRGSATDPQSLYARKRREKINERLRILQTLVPNGTKVDISTMLEEAVHYVKFLQLQIKLLSSDDMWMYAPICYNGMDLGLDFKLTTPEK